MRSRHVGTVSLLLLASACTQPAPPSSNGLPCDVSTVLATRCQSCHAAMPIYSAPMPLMNWNDTQANAVTDPSKKVWQLMSARINDPNRPMPPSGMLPANELATLNTWLAANAPKNPSSDACSTTDAGADAGPAVGPQALPCPPSEQKTFLAHAANSPTERFHVPADAGNLYMCFTWKSSFASPTQATAFAPVIDDARVVHHYILFQTATAQVDGGVGPCRMPLDAQFVSGWAPGGGNLVMPPDVGQTMPGTDRWFILQLHYWNVAGYADANDRSGLAMCTTQTLRTHNAAIHTLGSANILVPARGEATVTGTCTPTNTEPVHILGTGPHMHQTGVSFNTKILRGGLPTSAEMLIDLPRWNFESQTTYPTDKIVMPGDVLQTECRYRNPTDVPITFGERTEDEMCFNFVLAYPAGSLVNANGAVTNRCIDRRP